MGIFQLNILTNSDMTGVMITRVLSTYIPLKFLYMSPLNPLIGVATIKFFFVPDILPFQLYSMC